jgi:hypothetical protein
VISDSRYFFAAESQFSDTSIGEDFTLSTAVRSRNRGGLPATAYPKEY